MPRKRSWAQKETLRLAQEAVKKKRFLQKLQNELGAKFHPEIHDPVLGAQFTIRGPINRHPYFSHFCKNVC